MQHGYGVTRYAYTNEVYEGQWGKNRKHGIGKAIYPDGTTWEGEYRDGATWLGNGTFKYNNGNVYCGTIVNGLMHGQVCMRYGSNGDVYEGQ